MKKYYLFTALALAAILTGCSNEEEEMNPSGESKVTLFIDGPASRVVTNGNATTFEAGDQIVINSVGLAPEMENETFTVGEDGTLATDLTYYYDGNKSAKFYAHYPTTAISNQGTVSITVPEIQSSEEQYNAFDFMTSTATGSASTNNGGVSLKFAHRLSLVKIIWNGSNTATDIVMNKLKPTVTWTHETDALTTSGTATDIVMWKIDPKKQEYWALIPPQTITKGTQLLEIRDGDKVYPYIPNVDLAFNEKNIRKITLDTKEENGQIEVVATSISIDKWSDDEEIKNGDLVSTILPPDTLIYPDWGKFKNITELTQVTKATTQAGVWGYAANKDAKVELITEGNEKVIHLNIPKKSSDLAETDSCRWWNNALYYQLADSIARGIKPGKPYKLTLQMKAGTAAKGAMIQVLKNDESSNTYFGINNAKTTKPDTLAYNSVTYYPVIKEADIEKYNEQTYYVNFANVLTGKDKPRTTPGTIADFKKIVLMISINTGNSTANAYGVDFYFKDIEFREYIPEEE